MRCTGVISSAPSIFMVSSSVFSFQRRNVVRFCKNVIAIPRATHTGFTASHLRKLFNLVIRRLKIVRVRCVHLQHGGDACKHLADHYLSTRIVRKLFFKILSFVTSQERCHFAVTNEHAIHIIDGEHDRCDETAKTTGGTIPEGTGRCIAIESQYSRISCAAHGV